MLEGKQQEGRLGVAGEPTLKDRQLGLLGGYWELWEAIGIAGRLLGE